MNYGTPLRSPKPPPTERPGYFTSDMVPHKVDQPSISGMATFTPPTTPAATSTDLDDTGDEPRNEAPTTGYIPPRAPTAQYSLPEDIYAFKADSNTEASDEALAIANKETNLDKAIETLVPYESIHREVHSLKNCLNGATLAYEKSKATIAKVDGQPDYIYKSVNFNTTITLPYGTSTFSTTLDPILQLVTAQFDTLMLDSKKELSKLILESQRVICAAETCGIDGGRGPSAAIEAGKLQNVMSFAPFLIGNRRLASRADFSNAPHRR